MLTNNKLDESEVSCTLRELKTYSVLQTACKKEIIAIDDS
jgi:hypothetical protein